MPDLWHQLTSIQAQEEKEPFRINGIETQVLGSRRICDLDPSLFSGAWSVLETVLPKQQKTGKDGDIFLRAKPSK